MKQQNYVTSIFKSVNMTKEVYTDKWTELITVLDHNKNVNFPLRQ